MEIEKALKSGKITEQIISRGNQSEYDNNLKKNVNMGSTETKSGMRVRCNNRQ